MFRRAVVVAGAMTILLCALGVNLWVLDVASFQDLRRDLAKILSIMGITTVAILLMLALARMVQKK
jgi:hypothetical protein